MQQLSTSPTLGSPLGTSPPGVYINPYAPRCQTWPLMHNPNLVPREGPYSETEVSETDSSTSSQESFSSSDGSEFDSAITEEVISPRGFDAEYLRNEALTNVCLHKVRHDDQKLKTFFSNWIYGADLHVHTSGAIHPRNYVRWGKDNNCCYNFSEHRFKKVRSCSDDASLDNFQKHSRYTEFENRSTMKGCSTKDSTGHQHFFEACKVNESMADIMPLGAKFGIISKESIAENVLYRELKVDMHEDPPAEFLETFSFPAHLDEPERNAYLKEAVRQLQPWVDAYVEKHKSELAIAAQEAANYIQTQRKKKDSDRIHSITDIDSPVVMRFQTETMRDNSNDASVFANLLACMALSDADKSVVAIDLVGPEYSEEASQQFDKQIKMLSFLNTLYPEVNKVLHGGELDDHDANKSDLLERIHRTVFEGNVKALGHGTCISHDSKHDEVLEHMRKNDIPVEICPSSNLHILHIGADKLPISTYEEAGVDVVVCTDDPGINPCRPETEYMALIKMRPLDDYYKVKRWNRNGLHYARIEGKSIFTKVNNELELRAEFAHCYKKEWKHTASEEALELLKNSPKARLQIRLERRIARFEAKQARDYNVANSSPAKQPPGTFVSSSLLSKMIPKQLPNRQNVTY